MSRVLVTGANGYIGRHLTSALLQCGHDVVPTDIQHVSVDGYAQYAPADIRDVDACATLKDNVSIIFHCAGITGTWASFERYRDFIEVNEIGLLNVLETLRRSEKQAKVVFPSTRLVYDGVKDTLLQEDSARAFKTIYAMNKFACENYLKMYHDLFGLTYAVFRICVPYGNLLDEKLSYGTLSHFITQAVKGEPLTIWGDGSQKRTLIHIEDLIHLLIQAGFSAETNNGVFNIGGNNVLSVKDIAVSIAGKYGVDVNFVQWSRVAERLESGDTIFDSAKLDGITGYRMKHDFFTWLQDVS